ncbi:MAG: glutathione S-transferase [Cocleimonas sp.]
MNSLKLVIGNKNYSSWSLRPWFFLKNLQIAFDEELIFLYQDDFNDNMSVYSSDNKVPVLIDYSVESKPFEVWDSLAIIEYISDKHPNSQGWPHTLNARAMARSISAEMHSSFDAIRSALPMNCSKYVPDHTLSPEVLQNIDRVVSLWERCSKGYGQNGPWLFGEFSGADAMFAPIVIRFLGYGVPLTGFAKDYSQMVLENQYMQEWITAAKQEKSTNPF